MHWTTTLPALLLQTQTVGLTEGQTTLLMVFAGVLTLAIVIQCAILISFAAASAKARHEIQKLVTEIHGKSIPLIKSVQVLVDDTTPKIRVISSNLAEVSEILRAKAVEIDSVVADVSARTRRQSARVDGMVTDTLDSVENISGHIQHAVMGPVRQVAGIVAGVKAAIDKLKSRVEGGSSYDMHAGEERFGDGDEYHA
jgi:methyl-accepting chemotaxis protein